MSKTRTFTEQYKAENGTVYMISQDFEVYGDSFCGALYADITNITLGRTYQLCPLTVWDDDFSEEENVEFFMAEHRQFCEEHSKRDHAHEYKAGDMWIAC